MATLTLISHLSSLPPHPPNVTAQTARSQRLAHSIAFDSAQAADALQPAMPARREADAVRVRAKHSTTTSVSYDILSLEGSPGSAAAESDHARRGRRPAPGQSRNGGGSSLLAHEAHEPSRRPVAAAPESPYGVDHNVDHRRNTPSPRRPPGDLNMLAFESSPPAMAVPYVAGEALPGRGSEEPVSRRGGAGRRTTSSVGYNIFSGERL